MLRLVCDTAALRQIGTLPAARGGRFFHAHRSRDRASPGCWEWSAAFTPLQVTYTRARRTLPARFRLGCGSGLEPDVGDRRLEPALRSPTSGLSWRRS